MSEEPEAPRSGLLLALCLLLVACVYARVLGGPFIWDDRHLIGDAAVVQKLEPLQAFQQPFWQGEPGKEGSTSYYRPLTSISFVVDHWLYADNSSGFHLSSLLLHLLTVGLLFGLLRRRGAGASLAFLLTSCWALLPRLTEDAAWISGRGDLLASALSLAAFACYRRGSSARFGGALLLALLALLAKESGVAVLVALVVLELRQPAPPGEALPKRYGFLLAGVPLLAYLALRHAAGVLLAGDGLKLGAVGRGLAILEALGRYSWMTLNPLQPRSLLGELDRVAWPFVGLGAAALGGLLFAVRHWRRAAAETLALLAMAAASLGLVLHVVPLPLSVVAADRYLYLPLAALLLACAPALERLAQPRLLLALLAATLACGVRTFERAGDYADEAQFWTTAVRGAPQNAIALIELGSVAYRAGLFENALALDLKAIALGGPYARQALDNAALAATAAGDRAQAARLGDELLRRFPDEPAFELRRAVIALNAHDLAAAEAHVAKASALAPDFEQARSFSRVVQRARAASGDPHLSAAAAQSLDIEALRYAEVAARLDNLLDGPPTQDEALRPGLEFIVASGPPPRARQLFGKYAKRGAASAQDGPLAAALALRVEAAAGILTQLQTLGDVAEPEAR